MGVTIATKLPVNIPSAIFKNKANILTDYPVERQRTLLLAVSGRIQAQDGGKITGVLLQEAFSTSLPAKEKARFRL
jgi:hypothetical protein